MAGCPRNAKTTPRPYVSAAIFHHSQRGFPSDRGVTGAVRNHPAATSTAAATMLRKLHTPRSSGKKAAGAHSRKMGMAANRHICCLPRTAWTPRSNAVVRSVHLRTMSYSSGHGKHARDERSAAITRKSRGEGKEGYEQ